MDLLENVKAQLLETRQKLKRKIYILDKVVEKTSQDSVDQLKGEISIITEYKKKMVLTRQEQS